MHHTYLLWFEQQYAFALQSFVNKKRTDRVYAQGVRSAKNTGHIGVKA